MILNIFSFRSLLYLSYAIILTIVLGYIRFPQEKFKLFCESQISRFSKNHKTTINSISYTFPTTVILENIKLTPVSPLTPSSFHFDSVTLQYTPAISLQSFKLHGVAYSGDIDGLITLEDQTNTISFENIETKNIELTQIAEDMGLVDRSIAGLLLFRGDYSIGRAEPYTYNLSGTIELTSGNIGLSQPVLTLNSIKFDRVKARIFKKNNGEISISEGEFKSALFRADFKGYLTPQTPFVETPVFISGKIFPTKKFLTTYYQKNGATEYMVNRNKNTELTFSLHGTLNTPSLSFENS